MTRFSSLFFVLLPLFLFSQHQISGTFKPANEYDFVLLYHVTPGKNVYVADGAVDEQGNFNLTPKNLKPGVYKLIYKLPEEVYNFDIVYNGKEDITLTYIKGQGVQFHQGQNKILQDYLKEISAIEQEILSKTQSASPDKVAINALFNDLRTAQSKAENNADALTRTYMKSFQPYIPEKFENRSAFDIQRKSHYFDNMDFENSEIQASSFPLFLIKKYYYEYVTMREGQGYREAINDIYRGTRTTKSSYNKALMTEFWEYLMFEYKQNAANYLAERYLLALAKAENDTALVADLEQLLKTAMGAKAPNFELREADNTKTLHDLSGSQYYLLVFWSSECSHCVAQVPEVHKEVRAIPKSKLQTIAVGIEYDANTWRQITADFDAFINVLALDKWRDNLTLDYNITGTPSYFILDSDKKILVKPSSTNQVMDILEAIKNN